MKVTYGPEIFFQRYGGVPRYFTKLSEGMAQRGHSTSVVAPLFTTDLLQSVNGPKIRGTHLSSTPPMSRKILRTISVAYGRLQITLDRPDIVHPTYYSMWDSLPSNLHVAVTVFDFVHEIIGGKSASAEFVTRHQKASSIKRADLLLAISENTRQDLLNFYPAIPPDRVIVTHLGVDRPESLPSKNQSVAHRPYFLWVGPRGGYKNFSLLQRAIESMASRERRDFSLVVFGGNPLDTGEIRGLARAGLSSNQVRQVFGDDTDLKGLYQNARALIYISKYEGFGLPVLEAMANGCPVIASNSSSIPEVAGQSAVLIDPENVEELIEVIRRISADDGMVRYFRKLGRERSKLFSWSSCVEKTETAYASLQSDGPAH